MMLRLAPYRVSRRVRPGEYATAPRATRQPSHRQCVYRPFATLACLLLVSACSGGGTDSTGALDDDGTGGATPDVSDVITAPAGDILRYGAVTVSDDAGMASDLVGSFFRLASGVSADFLASMLSGQAAMCQVQDDDVIDFEEISAGYIPTVPGIAKSPVSAGDSIIISGPGGTFATLNEQPAAGFLFYDLDDASMLPSGPVPADLTVDVTGSGEIPAFTSVAIPDVTTLTGVQPGPSEPLSVDTRFSWDAGSEPGSMVRIFTTTRGGFFLDDGVTVTCVVPDTGSFTFPPATRSLLGNDFDGSPAIVSRIRVRTEQTGDTVLFVIRESFE